MVDDILDNVFVVVGIAVAVMASAVFLLVSIIAHISFPGEVAAIEQLRHDAPLTACSASEDVAGQIAQTNQRIMSSQAYDRVPVLGWTVPDGWRTVNTIPMTGGC